MGSKTASKTGKGGGKQNAGRIPTAKGQQQRKENDSKEQEVVHRTDLSVLRQPINISVRRVCDIVKMYQTCTAELRQLLDNEVEIVYECKVCRNLFRSMANIISHKRVYCRQQYNEAYYSFNKRHTMDDYTVIIQPEPVATSSEKETWCTSDKGPPYESNNEVALREIKATVPRIVNSSKPKKDLTQIIEELSDKKGIKNFKETVAHYSASSLYDDINKSLISRAQQRKEHAIHLEPTGSSSGVFQTKLQATTSTTIQAENIDLMKAQVIELQHMVRETEAVLDEEGRIVQIKGSCNGPVASPNKETMVILSPTNSTPESKDSHVCSQCGSRFSTRKTLAHHMKSLHTAYRLCYPCPCCKNTFTNSWSVYRHLYKVHRKTTAQVRKLRPQIQSKAFKREIGMEKLGSDSNSVDKVPPTEQEAARNEQNRIDQENKEWMDNFEDDQELQRCGGCGRRFERRAALTSHSQICQKRIAARKIKVPSTAHVSSEKSVLKNGSTDVTKPVTSSRENESKTETVPVSENIQRVRHPSGSNWSDAPKKEVLGKRIEIQIRRDYCKFGSNIPPSSQQQSNNFSRSVSPESIPNISPPIKDETESLLSEVDENEVDCLRKRNYDSRLDETESRITDTDKPVEVNPSEASQANTAISVGESHKRDATTRSVLRSKRRQASVDKELLPNCASIITPRKRRATVDEVSDRDGSASEANENSGFHENVKRRAQRSSSVEHFSPIMERKMHALINLKRLQCLPCQKKFNKLHNLRRHVAVHIGWNRYRCPICNYKCFAKCDCVHHVIKVHGNDRSEAEQIIQLIEYQGSDSSSNDKSPVLSSAVKTKMIKNETTVETNFSRGLTERDEECEALMVTNGVSLTYLGDDPEPESCKTEENRIQVFLFDGESANKDSDLGDPNSPLNCLGDADLDDSEVSYLVPEGEPVIHSLENNCNETVLNFIDENFHNQAPSINGDKEDDKDQEDQPETDYSRSDFENDSDVPENERSPASTDSKKNALRRMVMEVIFGSASASQMVPQIAVSNGFDSHADSPDDDSQDCREDSMEGSTGNGQEGNPEDDQVGSQQRDREASPDEPPEDGPEENSEGPEDVPEGSSDETATLPEEEQVAEMAAVHSDSSSQCSNRSNVERRKQPVRTRVCVRHDDFIYDGPSCSSVTMSKKVPKSQPQQQVDDAAVDRVPKVTLVRVGGSGSGSEGSGGSSTSAWRTSVMAVTENCTVASTSRTSVNQPRKATKVSDSLEKNSSK